MGPDDDEVLPGASGRRLVVAVLADTHLRRRDDGASLVGRLPAAVRAQLAGADLILHAGDVVDACLLEELGRRAPTVAVLGNNDHELVGVLPDERWMSTGGLRVAMVHDSGARAGREARLARRYPGADLVVFGHSHEPVDRAGVDGQRLFNPGSPTQRRRQPHPTMGVLVIEAGALVDHRVVRVDGPG